MSRLLISSAERPAERRVDTTDADEIARRLAERGIVFSRWTPVRPLPDAGGLAAQEILSAYAPNVQQMAAEGYGTVDVVTVSPAPSDPAWPQKALAMREKFRAEHTHAEAEIRLFVAGRGLFYLRLDDDAVYLVLCERGDAMSIPGGTRHWFDMGSAPRFSALRFFTNLDGWVGAFTGDSIASRFPTLDEL